MTKSTITREQLTEELKRRISVTERYPDLETAQIDAIICKMALTAMDSEPVAYADPQSFDNFKSNGGKNAACTKEWMWRDHSAGLIPLYRHAQPAPVVPDERAVFNAWNNDENLPIAGVGAKNAAWLAWQARASLCGNSVLDVPPERPADSSNGDDVEAWFDEGWNACRAAMLQAEPVTTANKLGNSPVIPDGWKLVPVEPNGDMLAAAQDAYGETDGDIASTLRAAMLAAAPQLTGSDPATVPDTWIPVSERMPENEVDVQIYCPGSKEQMVGYLERNEQEGYFRYATWRTGDGIYCQPSHWMPLPASPQEVK